MPALSKKHQSVYKAHAVWNADRAEPGVEAEQVAKMPHSSATGGGWARDGIVLCFTVLKDFKSHVLANLDYCFVICNMYAKTLGLEQKLQ